ncbi:HTH-type transcriptional regulator yisV [Fusarium agapanthi]|uniref:HTH-type transcriptional regulator yisV n=1 Tax=Fusarium agapanthi TaxID=1803897 RepID=A0A9P5BK34_9HYPO|nr:HTH-type transcriptional regulator yisV [Fusarium agapanthi]
MGELGISKAASKIRNWRRSCKLEIELVGHYLAKIYSSGSVVRGDLSISPASDIYASSIIISLNSVTTIRTVGQKLTTTTHRFLKMDLISSDILELVSATLKKNHSYKIPFQFTLPHELNPTDCTHNAVSTSVTNQHLTLPPTVGGEWDGGDMSPRVAEVEYMVNVCFTPTPSLDTDQSHGFTAKRTIRFIPRLSESLPLHVSLTSRRYKLQGTKSLRRNSLKRPFGTIIAATMQPEPLYLQAYGTVIAPTFIDVTLTFNPEVDEITPPTMDNLSLSLRSYTWHQADPYQAFHDQNEKPSLKQPLIATIELAVYCPQLSRARHVDPEIEIKNPENSSAEFYSSTLQLPLSVSTNLSHPLKLTAPDLKKLSWEGKSKRQYCNSRKRGINFWLALSHVQSLRKLRHRSDTRVTGYKDPNLTLLYNKHRGETKLREFIANDAGVSADDVLITSGAAGALFIITTSQLGSTPNSERNHLVVVRPDYATNLETPKAVGCDISYIDVTFENGFQPNIDEVEAAIKSNSRLVSVTCPHNPTGSTLSLEALDRLVTITKNGVLLLVDETYRDIAFAEKLPVAASLGDHILSVCSLSKSFGMPGVCIGWLITTNKTLQETFSCCKGIDKHQWKRHK